MPQLIKAFEGETGYRVSVSFGSSGNFVRQIRQGAPYEVFLSLMVIYLVLTWIIQRSFGWIEKRMSRHVRREI